MLDNLLESTISNKDEVEQLNENITRLYSTVKSICQPKEDRNHNGENQSKDPKKRMHSKQPWFNIQCLTGKRSLRILAQKYGKAPEDTTLRCQFYESRRE